LTSNLSNIQTMKTIKYLRFFMLLLYIIIASIIPFPIKFYKKDHLPTYTIEQIDKQEENENLDDESKFSF